MQKNQMDKKDRELVALLEERGLNIVQREDGKLAIQDIAGPDEFGQYDLVAEWSLERTA